MYQMIHQLAYKPGSVSAQEKSCRLAAIHLGEMLPSPSCNPPERLAAQINRSIKCRAPLLFGLASGGVYHAFTIAGQAVGSYPTLSPLPAF